MPTLAPQSQDRQTSTAFWWWRRWRQCISAGSGSTAGPRIDRRSGTPWLRRPSNAARSLHAARGPWLVHRNDVHQNVISGRAAEVERLDARSRWMGTIGTQLRQSDGRRPGGADLAPNRGRDLV